MKNWQDNKKSHDEYWGRLYDYLVNNKADNVKQEWTSLFNFEIGNKKELSYIKNGDIVTSDFNTYFKEKNKYLQIILDKYLTDTTDYVIDLGSGWGRHSIQLAFNNPTYKIISGELSDSGRKITQYFINKYNLNVESFPFNWYDQTSLIDILKQKSPKEIVIFTSNTIEQIPELNTEFFLGILDLPIDKVSVVHIEPVKFQYDGTSFPFNNHYNKNLKLVLESLVSMGKIEIKNIEHQYWGHSVNLTSKNNTLIEWVKKH